MRRISFLLLVVLMSLSAVAQMADPIHFSSQLRELGNGEGEVFLCPKYYL